MMKEPKKFVLKTELSLGDLVTPLSILVSLIAVWYTWHKDGQLRTQEYADHIRRSTSLVTAKVERWGELADRYFQDIQPTLLDVSEQVAKTHSVEPANRVLYRGLMDAEAKASQRIGDEQLQISYMELYSYVPTLQTTFDQTISEIKIAETESHKVLADKLQSILRNPDILKLSDSPAIGNELRSAARAARASLREQIQGIADPLRKKMVQFIQLGDGELANASRRSEIWDGMARVR
jgi:hypothetical protein